MLRNKVMAAVEVMGLAVVLSAGAVHADTLPRREMVREPKTLQEYLGTVDDISKVRFYDSDQLSPEILKSRKAKGLIIIERVEGVCDDSALNGREISPWDEDYNYISYRNATVPVTEGDIVNTYFVYNSKTNAPDDIIKRYDEVVKDF